MVQVQVCVQSRQLVHKFCKISNTLSKAKSLSSTWCCNFSSRTSSAGLGTDLAKKSGRIWGKSLGPTPVTCATALANRKAAMLWMMEQSRLKLSWEVATLRESPTRGERGVQRDKHETARPKGKLSQALREANRGKSWTNHDPPYAEEVAQWCRCTLDFESSI